MENTENQKRKTQKRTPIFKFAKERVTVIAFLDTRNMKENEKYPVRICITYLSKQIYYTPGIDLTESEYSELITGRKAAIDRRSFIKKHFDIVEKQVIDLIDNSPSGFSLIDLQKRLGKGKRNSLADNFNARVKELQESGKLGTAEWYEFTLKSIQSFTKKDLTFADITAKWLHDYENFMTDKQQSLTTVSMRMRALRAILFQARKENIISAAQWPFGEGKYIIRKGKGRKLALNLNQIGEILHYKTKSITEERCRDLWMFSYYCNGININDILRLKFKNIENNEVNYCRTKTEHQTSEILEIKSYLSPKMIEIIEKWGNLDKSPDNYIFPFLRSGMSMEDERKVIKNVTRLTNKKMQIIGKELGLGKISTYTARHSYSTILMRSGTNIAYISESLGHKDIKTTKNYLKGFEKDERIEASQKIDPDFKQPLRKVK